MDKNDKFNKLVAKWFRERRMYFSSSSGKLKLIIEFGAGGESIGDAEDDTFSWQDLMEMAESQGLL